MSPITTLAALTALFDRAPVLTDVPGVGSVYLRKLTAGEVSAWQADIIGTDLKPTRDGLFKADAALAAMSVCDGSGVPLMSTTQAQENLSADIVRAIARAARTVNKISAAKEEEAEGN